MIWDGAKVGTEETTRFKRGHPEPETCAACLHRNIKIRDQAPLAGCGDYQAWTQIDDPNQDPAKCFFPQVDAVDALHKHYPDAVYLLPRRDTEDWVRSVVSARRVLRVPLSGALCVAVVRLAGEYMYRLLEFGV